MTEREWPSVTEIGAHTGGPLGKIYTESVEVEFAVTLRHRDTQAAIAFSGGGWVPTAWPQIPVALRIGMSGYFQAFKGPTEGWTAVEPLIYQVNETYIVEMGINVKDNTYCCTVYTTDKSGGNVKPHRIDVDFPFRLGTGAPPIPAITAIDTVYLGPGNGKAIYIIRDFRVVDGK